jgi:hypothetical protein
MDLDTSDKAVPDNGPAGAPQNEAWQFSIAQLLVFTLVVACGLSLLRLMAWREAEYVAFLTILIGCLGWLARTSDGAVRGVIVVGYVACAPFFLPAAAHSYSWPLFLQLMMLYVLGASIAALFLAGLTALLRGYLFGGVCAAVSIAVLCCVAARLQSID